MEYETNERSEKKNIFYQQKDKQTTLPIKITWQNL